MTKVTTPIRTRDGDEVGELTVATLPGRGDWLERDGDRVVVEEGSTYRFEIVWPEAARLDVEPGEELFSFDDETRTSGRLLPRQHVGRIRVSVGSGDGAGAFVLSVRPRKLSAETEYHQMLDDIAQVAVEAMLQGFAPAVLPLSHRPGSSPKLLYQQFAFIHARLASTGAADLALILHQPHRGWVDMDELRLAGTPVRGGTRTLRALTRPGARVASPPTFGLASVPTRLAVTVSNETLDTDANRFVKFALERWRRIAIEVRNRLTANALRTGPISRGTDAADEVVAIVDRTLNSPMFKEVGRLRAFPTANTVLQNRAGYREILKTFVLAETGAQLALDWDIDDVFSASQRNVATLYEYWAFLQLTSAISAVCGEDLAASAFVPSTDGLSLGFPQGQRSRLTWTVRARERTMIVELYFNRSFLVSERPDSSWTRAMRPDSSILVQPAEALGDVSAAELSMWLHFDAKYTVEHIRDQFSPGVGDDVVAAAEAEETERVSQSKREDLLKMHAYRDAIRRSAGAYVLYPGSGDDVSYSEHNEILPGLGAFSLRPASGRAVGIRQLETFLHQVIDHAADRATQHERSRYWGAVIRRTHPVRPARERSVPQLDAPPRDVPVLCGYVRNADHRSWIEKTGLYNVRAGNRRGAVSTDARALQPTDIVLYGPETPPRLWRRAGAWFVQGRSELQALGYPEPGGETYLVCPVELTAPQPEWMPSVGVSALATIRGARGAPFVLTWNELLSC